MSSPDAQPVYGSGPDARPDRRRPLVRIRGLRFSYGPRVVFDGVDLDLHHRRVTAIVGPSGSGKTTLMRLIGGQLRPSAGTVEFDGVNVHTLGWRDLFELR